MSIIWSVCARILLCLAVLVLPLKPQNLSSEKHHTLILENKLVRVYHLKLVPSQATDLHHQTHPNAYLTLQDAEISNEAPEHKPNVVDVTAGDVHTSKGGFDLVERNVGSRAADLLIVERLGDATPFSDSMVDCKIHNASIGPLFEQAGMRAYATPMAVEGRIEALLEPHDRLVIAETDVALADKTEEQDGLRINLRAGEVKWLPKGGAHSLFNIGNAACSFITFEFP